ncbi:unnamed protein product [Schistosoma turkestanicum]|nr:unnamed protein product [Schistosoma turkestanicum]
MNTMDVNHTENNGNKKVHLVNMGSNEVKSCSRRGRKSTIPPELREQTRRIKKQNIERSRRACIANKMSELHQLAMNLIGLNISEQSKTEKVDILGMCYEVFKNVTILFNERPELKEKLKQMCHKVGLKSLNKHHDLSTVNHDMIIRKTDASNTTYSNIHQSPSIWNKENYNPTNQHLLIPSELSAFTPLGKLENTTNFHIMNQLDYQSTPIQLPFITNDSGYFEMNHSSLLSSSSSLIFHANKINSRSINLSNEFMDSTQSSCFQHKSINSILQSNDNIDVDEKQTVHTEETKENLMWRPYLD